MAIQHAAAVAVGYAAAPIEDGFSYDTRIRGNANAEHAFDDGSPQHGVIGRNSPEESTNLIEHLQTL